MRKLYCVHTENYEKYYVLANGFDEAKARVEKKMVESNSENILKSDGSLNLNRKSDFVTSVECLGSKFII